METEAIAMGNNMRLGKGLEALLGNVAASAPAEQDESKESVRILSINQIDPNPYQPRRNLMKRKCRSWRTALRCMALSSLFW